ncbi:MAG TPA: NUDIX hydrolase [Candidatus Paceibacterota bacterium]|nr:NUDIX hydrolase [Candidatus Paceibacterota bacterium]
MIEIVERVMKIDDKEIVYENARCAPGVRLIIPMPQNKILLTREYRTYLSDYVFRLPGGKVVDSLEEYNAFLKSDADIKDAARAAAIKEAREEVGLVVNDVELFAISKCGASIEWDLYYFVVKSFTEAEQQLEHEEDITLALTDIEEVKKMCLDGRMKEEHSALILLQYLSQAEL